MEIFPFLKNGDSALTTALAMALRRVDVISTVDEGGGALQDLGREVTAGSSKPTKPFLEATTYRCSEKTTI